MREFVISENSGEVLNKVIKYFGGGGSPGVSSMTEDEINAILNEITDSRQKTCLLYTSRCV